MLALDEIELKQTRFYQEIAEEERQIGEQIGEQRGMQIGEQIGEQRGRQEECISLVTRLLRRKFGIHPELATALAQLPTVPVEKLEDLAEAVIDWTEVNALTEWLRRQLLGSRD